MSNLYRPSIDASYQASDNLAKRFQRRRFFRNQSIRNKNCLAAMFVNGLDGWTFPEKYDKCPVSATIGRSNVENDPVVMSCNMAQAVAAFGRYISSLIVTIAAVVDLMKFFEKRKKTWPENLGIFFVWPYKDFLKDNILNNFYIKVKYVNY